MPSTTQPVSDTERRLWGSLAVGSSDLGGLLGTGPSPRVPFALAGQLKDEARGEGLARRNAAVRTVLLAPPRLEQVDPRGLLATQGGLDREGVRHYLGSAYPQRGVTYADHDDIGNADPVILVRGRDGARLILAGHHRATASLLRGQPLLARVVDEVATGPRRPTAARHATPLLTFGSPPLWESDSPDSTPTAAQSVRGGRCAHVRDAAAAAAVLVLLGAGEAQASRRVSYATTGRFS